MKSYCVVGSLNMDLVASVHRFPLPGQTVIGKKFGTFPGGKGGNQAVALKRLGAQVSMVAKTGDDVFGERYRNYLAAQGIEVSFISVEKDGETGVAVIAVEEMGENNIIVIPGANGAVTVDFLRENKNFIQAHDFVLLQLEIPLESVYSLLTDRNEKATYILDPTPPQGPIPETAMRAIDYITPNEKELEALSGIEPLDEDSIYNGGRKLLQQGARNVVVKAGARGAYLISTDAFLHVPAFPVQAIDTTGAGDTFNAGLACALGEGREAPEAIRFANAAAALSITRKGAQEGMPTRSDLDRFVNEQKPVPGLTT